MGTLSGGELIFVLSGDTGRYWHRRPGETCEIFEERVVRDLEEIHMKARSARRLVRCNPAMLTPVASRGARLLDPKASRVLSSDAGHGKSLTHTHT